MTACNSATPTYPFMAEALREKAPLCVIKGTRAQKRKKKTKKQTKKQKSSLFLSGIKNFLYKKNIYF
jgi:hypothetical protein